MFQVGVSKRVRMKVRRGGGRDCYYLFFLLVVLVWFHFESLQCLNTKVKEPLEIEMVGEIFKTRK